MERPRHVSNGGFRVPIGFRFRPTDAELLVHYLSPKVLSVPFPASVIPELDVFQTDPWSLPGNLNEKRYFFCDHRKMNKCGRAAGAGHWRHVGKDKLVLAPRSNRPIGVRKTLAFRLRGIKTRWFMHQFCLLGSESTEMRDWAVYCLFQKKRRRVTSKPKNESSLRSCCSGVTDVEDSENESALLDQEASSAWLH